MFGVKVRGEADLQNIKEIRMAIAVKTPWRNAACLMFMTGPFRFSRPPQRLTEPLSVGHSPFIQYDCPGNPQPELLFVKRHSKSGFMVRAREAS